MFTIKPNKSRADNQSKCKQILHLKVKPNEKTSYITVVQEQQIDRDVTEIQLIAHMTGKKFSISNTNNTYYVVLLFNYFQRVKY